LTEVNLGNVKGDTGSTGATGAEGNGIKSVGLISAVGVVKTYRILFDDDTYFDFEVIDGSNLNIVDNLSSESSTDVLSANQGRVLNLNKLDANQGIENVGKYLKVDSGGNVIPATGGGGSVDIVTAWESTLSDEKVPSEKLTKNTLDTKQATLVSGTNIKTINNNSLLGSGNIDVGAVVGTFSDLQDIIDDTTGANPVIILDKDYKYDSTTDSSLTNGVTIQKNITIIGNGHVIDGNNSKRAFLLYGSYNINLCDLKIQNCKSLNAGAIDIYNGTTVNIDNITCHNNSGTEGGVITINNATINITNSVFTKNITTGTTGDGGVIYATTYAHVIAKNSVFSQNNAGGNTGRGGAIYATTYSTLSLSDCIFKDNESTNYDNIYCSSSTTVVNCSIPNIATSCYQVTNKPYLTDHQSLSGYLTTSDIVNDLTTGGTTKVLSAEQGKELATMIGDAITYINGTGS